MRTLITLFITFFFYSCNKKENLTYNFIQKSKNKDLSRLINVIIEAREVRNDTLRYYYSHNFIGNDTIDIPSIEFFDDLVNENKEHYFLCFDKLSKYSGDSTINKQEYARRYAQKIDIIYKDLGVINSKSNPNLGKFIEFTLDEKCKVYSLENISNLNTYWKEKFSTLKKVDDKWFYECK
jgi:hypothetical protein